MITQRLVADQGTMQGRLTIECDRGNANSYAELLSLREELALRANVRTEGSVITLPPPDEVPPPPPEG